LSRLFLDFLSDLASYTSRRWLEQRDSPSLQAEDVLDKSISDQKKLILLSVDRFQPITRSLRLGPEHYGLSKATVEHQKPLTDRPAPFRRDRGDSALSEARDRLGASKIDWNTMLM
jgi:hypothetical protein